MPQRLLTLVPSLEGAGNPRWTVVRHCVREDEHAVVRITGAERLEREQDEVVAVAGDQDAAILRSAPQLLTVGQSTSPDVMDADNVEPQVACDPRGGRVHVLVEQVPERRFPLRHALPGRPPRRAERQLPPDPLRSPRGLPRQPLVDLLGV